MAEKAIKTLVYIGEGLISDEPLPGPRHSEINFIVTSFSAGTGRS
jgi:hypothetical protein